MVTVPVKVGEARRAMAASILASAIVVALHVPDVTVPTVVAAAALTAAVVTTSVLTSARSFGLTTPSEPVSTKYAVAAVAVEAVVRSSVGIVTVPVKVGALTGERDVSVGCT